nr:GspH/FimT family pseudopilin [uncultured Desulfobulbus sp.]
MNTTHKYTDASEHGFTLMEVMVVVAIVGIMSMIAIPSYLSWKPGYEFRGAVSRIASDLNKAKMRALEIRRECRVVFCGNQYQIVDGDKTMGSDWTLITGNSTCLTNAEQSTLSTAGRRVRNVSLADYNNVTATINNPIIFSPRGLARSNVTTTVTHGSSNDSVGITVIQTGRVHVGW